MENSFGSHGSDVNEVSLIEPSLLLLNDDCLMNVFNRLELMDFVNLAKTCVRLKNVAGDISVRKFKSVCIVKMKDYPPDVIDKLDSKSPAKIVTKRQFSEIISFIGTSVLSIKTYNADDFILRTIRKRCKNVNCLKGSYMDDSWPILHEFKSLKELVISRRSVISMKYLQQIIINNPGLETLEFDSTSFTIAEFKEFVKFLRLLHNKLKSLRLGFIPETDFDGLFHLKALTEFEFSSFRKCSKFLNQLATNWNLVKLEFKSAIDDETFNSIQLFETLEHLNIHNTRGCYAPKPYTLPEHTVFPPNLKRLSIFNIHLPYRKLASIVEQLKMLEQIHINLSSFQTMSVKAIISGIVTALCPVLQQRTITIFVSDTLRYPEYFYKSDQLKIINDNHELKREKASNINLVVKY